MWCEYCGGDNGGAGGGGGGGCEVLVVDMKDEDKVQNFQLLCKVQFGF